MILIPTLFFVKKASIYYEIGKNSIPIEAILFDHSIKGVAGPTPKNWRYQFEYNGEVFEGTISSVNFFKQPLFTTSFLETGIIPKDSHKILVFYSENSKVHLPFIPTTKHWILLFLNYTLVVVFALILVSLVL